MVLYPSDTHRRKMNSDKHNISYTNIDSRRIADMNVQWKIWKLKKHRRSSGLEGRQRLLNRIVKALTIRMHW